MKCLSNIRSRFIVITAQQRRARITRLPTDMEQLRYFVEKQAFGVCSALGERMNIPASSVRRYFIYTSCLTLGSPVIVYLFMAFWLEMRTHLRRSNHPTVWDL
jgi:phage shock protein C